MGIEGHRAIAFLAEELISPYTQAQVERILHEGRDKDLISISTWADEVRDQDADDRELPSDTQSFNQAFPANFRWHFVNLPLGASSYAASQRFTHGDQIVEAIEHCIKVLESPEPLAGEPSRPQALRLLVHLVGDIHQPLHCATGYYQLRAPGSIQLIKDPESAFGLPNDRGGNDLYCSPMEKLHSFWDSFLVERIANSPDYRVLAAHLKKNCSSYLPEVTPSDYHRWPEIWVIESVGVAANSAYAGIEFGPNVASIEHRPLRIAITLPPRYEEKNAMVAAEQLVKAAGRLAQLLDRIHW
jgi:hypothetical protein